MVDRAHRTAGGNGSCGKASVLKTFGTDQPSIEAAGEILRGGGVVVIPTETVYGLACSIHSESAIRRVFEIKRRPAENPLIVHIADLDTLESLVEEVTETARTLAGKFWPGPLTLVLPKSPSVSNLITAGGSTVAIRMPEHSSALLLIRAAGAPLAAPSANRFTQLSPTSADQVDAELLQLVDGLVDGGRCRVGIESTVVDCTGPTAKILRPGVLSRDELVKWVEISDIEDEEGPKRSPGAYLRHYSPTTRVRIANALGDTDAGVTLSAPRNSHQLQLPSEPSGYAQGIYAALHALDLGDHKELVIQAPPTGATWEAIWDRLRKATGS